MTSASARRRSRSSRVPEPVAPGAQVAGRGVGGPGLADFAVEPAPGVGQSDRRIDRFDLRSVLGADALNTQHVGPLHGYSPDRWRALFCASAGPSRYTGPEFRFGPGGSNLPASARYRRQPGSSQARPAPPAPVVSTFNARGDGVEQAHASHRHRPGDHGGEARGPAAAAAAAKRFTDSDRGRPPGRRGAHHSLSAAGDGAVPSQRAVRALVEADLYR